MTAVNVFQVMAAPSRRGKVLGFANSGKPFHLASLTFRLIAVALCAGSAVAAGADSSCLVPKASVAEIVGVVKAADADRQLSVLRPCVGKVAAGAKGPVEVLFGTKGGSNKRLPVRAGEGLQDRIGKALEPGDELIDIWPDKSILSALGSWMVGKAQTTSGVSGFDGPSDAMPLAGELAALPDTQLPLKLYGWAPDKPVVLSQGGKAVTLVPANGWLKLPVGQLKPGELRLEQAGKKPAILTVLEERDMVDLRQSLKAIDAQNTDPAQRAVLRSAALQQQQLLVNAVAEYMRGR